ncbi:TniB family NTP-binding protein [Sphingobium sp.]|uniref:TniB family NTP-binding protein n=1 Tax=Sphingobium sp. TaxID=1912891 RepID=UPI0026240C70|nr:TniB family NTP-binding protein [Sphingobium sp.]
MAKKKLQSSPQKPPQQKVSGGFAPGDLHPQSGFPEPRQTQESTAQLRVRNQVIREIYIHNPNHAPVFKALDGVISMGVKGVYQTGVRNAAESYAGKSSAGDEFARIIAARNIYAQGTRPVVRVELEQACTSRRFWSAINTEYGDDFAGIKDEEKGRRSAYENFEKHGTVLLILDEIQHAGYRSKGSSTATDVIKRFISDAQVGLGLFGNEDALDLLQSNNQLSHRLQEPCDIRPLDLSHSSEQAKFTTFVQKYDAALVEKKLFTELSNLADSRTVFCLMAISRGYLGRVVALVRIAAKRAFLRGADHIEVCDLSHATRTWAIDQKLIDYNPFTWGLPGDV